VSGAWDVEGEEEGEAYVVRELKSNVVLLNVTFPQVCATTQVGNRTNAIAINKFIVV
jgi:hypothetical protein